MSFFNHNCDASITAQISSTEDAITGVTNRIRGLEDLLDNPSIPVNKRDEIEGELLEMKNLLDQNKEILKGLQKDNTKSFAVTVCIALFCFFVYLLYTMSRYNK